MRQLTPKSQLDTLKTEAKRWLKAVRAGEAEPLERLKRGYPRAPANPTLRDIQHALAQEHGLSGWPALLDALADLALARRTDQERAEDLLQHAWQGDVRVSMRVLQRHPEVARHSLHTAVACGDLAEVKRRLAEDPTAASAKGGPHGWEPLLYLCYSHLPLPAVADNAIAMATALLDSGADPKAEFNDGWDNSFTCLTGVIGEGEGPAPAHPKAEALAELLIARGADPFDTQALYNTSLRADDPRWMAFLYGHSAARGDTGRWTAVEGSKLGGNWQLSPIGYLLGNAVSHNHPRRTEWLVAHGGDPNGKNAYSGRPLHEVAQLSGFLEMADLLVRLGAKPVPLEGAAAFQAAVMRLDRETAADLARRHPEILANPHALTLAAAQGRTSAVKLMLELGVAVDVPDHNGRRALHAAAQSNAVACAEALIAAGADIDKRGTQYNATPLGFAVYHGHQAMIDYLTPLSADVFGLTTAGKAARLEALLRDKPDLAQATGATGRNALFFLPLEEEAAAAVTAVLLAHGADPALPDNEGQTALAEARRRGLEAAADLMSG